MAIPQKTMHNSYAMIWRLISKRPERGVLNHRSQKYQNTVTQDMEEKIISMYAKGMTTNDIESHMWKLYDIEISEQYPSAGSRIKSCPS